MLPNLTPPSARLRPLAVGALLCACLAGCGVRSDVSDSSVVRGQQLTPCSIEGTPFANIPFKDWPDTYHRTVGEIVQEFILNDPSMFSVDCTKLDEGDGSEIASAGSAVAMLAAQLGPWADGKTPVTRLQTGDVLRAYLDAYMCSLHEKNYALELTTTGSNSSGAPSTNASSTSKGSSSEDVDRGDLAQWVAADREIISRELATAEPTMERVLTLFSAYHRTISLNTELDCLLRSSTDLRNALALFSEASACVGRIWDTKSILRDDPAAAQ